MSTTRADEAPARPHGRKGRIASLARGLVAVSALALCVAPEPSQAASSSRGRPLPGAYCPIPEPGEQAACMEVAREEYPDFLDSVDSGALDTGATQQLEDDLSSSERAYLALSSLAYAYYRLAEQAASEPDQSPILIDRLDRWNALLSQLYERSEHDPALQRAVRAAAEDLHRRAPPVASQCRDANGRPAKCQTTDVLLQMLRQADAQSDRHGVRGALTQFINRLRNQDADAP